MFFGRTWVICRISLLSLLVFLNRTDERRREATVARLKKNGGARKELGAVILSSLGSHGEIAPGERKNVNASIWRSFDSLSSTLRYVTHD